MCLRSSNAVWNFLVQKIAALFGKLNQRFCQLGVSCYKFALPARCPKSFDLAGCAGNLE